MSVVKVIVTTTIVIMSEVSSSFFLYVIFTSSNSSYDILTISRIILPVVGKMMMFVSTRKTTLRWSSQHLMTWPTTLVVMFRHEFLSDNVT